MLDLGIPVTTGGIGGFEDLKAAVGRQPTVEAVGHAAGSATCAVGADPTDVGQPG
jgi:hypothetical protein